MLVAQESPSLTTTTGSEGTWTLHALEGLQAHLHLETISCTVPLAEVYDRLVFQHAEEAP